MIVLGMELYLINKLILNENEGILETFFDEQQKKTAECATLGTLLPVAPSPNDL